MAKSCELADSGAILLNFEANDTHFNVLNSIIGATFLLCLSFCSPMNLMIHTNIELLLSSCMPLLPKRGHESTIGLDCSCILSHESMTFQPLGH